MLSGEELGERREGHSLVAALPLLNDVVEACGYAGKGSGRDFPLRFLFWGASIALHALHEAIGFPSGLEWTFISLIGDVRNF